MCIEWSNFIKKHRGTKTPNIGVCCIIDVGSGQVYLSQVLSFEYQFYVMALDASLHHATVTNEWVE